MALPETNKSEKEFVFGEKLTDRVICTASEGTSSELTSKLEENTTSESTTNMKQSASGSLWPTGESENGEKYSTENALENDVNTVIKLNCKLFVLESNKANWLERGYGILKLIDLNDGYNCKLMMWTDKCFRLILNTKFFEKMQIDRANKKSIRFNAFDNGTIRIFLIKTSNPNDCDELFEILKIRLNEYNDYTSKNDESRDNSLNTSGSSAPKSVVFKTECELFKDSDGAAIKANLRLYSFASSSNSANHQLFLGIFLVKFTFNSVFQIYYFSLIYVDLVDPADENVVHLSTYLKLIKLLNEKIKKEKFEFEISESVISSSSTNSSSNYRVVINDNESVSKFLNFYNKEPKFKTNLDNSSDDEENDTDEESEDSHNENEEYDEKIRKSNSINESERFASSEDTVKTTEDSCSQENLETGEMSRKRKNDEVDEDSSSSVPVAFKKQDVESSSQTTESSTNSQSVAGIKRNVDETSANEDDENNLKKSR